MSVRDDIPILNTKDPPIYWDNACVSLRPQPVIDAITEYYEEYPACAGRSTHSLAEAVEKHIEQARTSVRRFFNAKEDAEVLFTRNTTESINLVAYTLHLERKTVLLSDKEHNSNLVPWQRRAERRGEEIAIIPTNDGVLDMDAYEAALKEHDVGLVAMHQVSNVDGIENPVKEMAKLAHAHGARILIDGAQAAGHMPVDVRALGVDFYAASAHKMLGPAGMGVLYVQEEQYADMTAFMTGGDTVEDTTTEGHVLKEPPHRYEAGLQDYPGMIAFGAAANYLDRSGLKKVHKEIQTCRKALKRELAGLPVYVLNDHEDASILTIIPQHMDAGKLSQILSGRGIMTRAGRFCVNSYFNKHDLPAAIRFSPQFYNTEEEAKRIAEELRKLKKIL